jgi:hypothetical protein
MIESNGGRHGRDRWATPPPNHLGVGPVPPCIHIAGTRDLLGLGWKDPLYDCSGIACPVLLFSASGMEGVPGLD